MTQDMTKGPITNHLITFTIPLILGNIFQLTYNAVDSIIVGQFAGDNALAAVGTADPIMNLLILGITGLCIGASVLMSNFFGAGQQEQLKQEFGTMFMLGMILALVITVGGLIASPYILSVMQVPKSILSEANQYLSIIFIGMPFTCLFNIYASALRSVGDSKSPIRFLILASVLNALLDLLFIAVLQMNVVGAALATVIAEAVSAILCIVYVYRRVSSLHLNKTHLVFHKKLVKQTIQYGGVTALQQCTQPIGKLLIQGVINTLGVNAIAAFNAIGKIEDFGLVPGRSISNSMMTFTAQNQGANQPERIKKGFRQGMLMEFCYWIFICVVLLITDRFILSWFSQDSLTQSEGLRYFGVMAFFYWLPGFTNGLQGFFRGVGKMQITLYGTITQVTFRVLFTFLLVPRLGLVGVAWACIAGWLVMITWESIYLWYYMKKLR